MLSLRMYFYVTITPDGLYHVQNYVGMYRGQHHVHSEKGYKNWLKGFLNKPDITIKKGNCECGLKEGDVREYDGQIWHKEEFE